MEREQLIGALRSALTALDDLPTLRHNPLLQLFTRNPHGTTPTALQRLLLESIDSLKRAGELGSIAPYDVLYYRYVEQLPQPDVAFQLGMSVRQLRRHQNSAIEALADLLTQQYLAPATSALHEEAETSATGMQNEVAWLRRGNPAAVSSVEREWLRAREEVGVLARHYGVTMAHDLPEYLPSVTLPPTLLRQTLLTLLSALIPQITSLQMRGAHTLEAGQLQLSIIATPQLTHASQGIYSTVQAAVQAAAQMLAPFGSTINVATNELLRLDLTFVAATGIPVLLIDDNQDIRYLFQRYAAESRFHIIDSHDSAHALELAQQFQVAAIILDIMMPALDGWELVAQLRHHPATQRIPIIVCSILPQQDLSYHLGVAAFMQKPVSRATFLSTLDSLLPLTQPLRQITPKMPTP